MTSSRSPLFHPSHNGDLATAEPGRGADEAIPNVDPRIMRMASLGMRGSGGQLPHQERIQHSFGRHDVSRVKAHVGGPAADASAALGAKAYAKGDEVAFSGAPDLHTAAHEAAHVVQQRSGVQLKAAIDTPGDRYEQHADRVADAVVAGQSAEGLLDEMAGGGASSAVVQRKAVGPPDLGNYGTETGEHVERIRKWDNGDIGARRVALQKLLATEDVIKQRQTLMREYEAVQWVAKERGIDLTPMDPQEAAERKKSEANHGADPSKWWLPDTPLQMRSMIEREIGQHRGFREGIDAIKRRIGMGTTQRSAENDAKAKMAYAELTAIDHDASEFRTAFKPQVRLVADAMLAESAGAIDKTLAQYGIPGGSHRLTTAAQEVARDPSKVDVETEKWILNPAADLKQIIVIDNSGIGTIWPTNT